MFAASTAQADGLSADFAGARTLLAGGETDIEVPLIPEGQFVPNPPKPAPEKPSERVGKMAMDFQLTDRAREMVLLSDFRGQVVLLDFFATWCPICRRAIPKLTALHNELGDKGLVVLGVNVDETDKEIADLEEKLGFRMPYRIVFDGWGMYEVYGVVGFPTYFLVGKDGRILYHGHRLDSVLGLLDEALKAPVPSS